MIYLDCAGGELIRPEIVSRYAEYCARYSLNPHGGTKLAEACRRGVLDAGRRVLASLGIPENEADVVWTSGGTESLNLALLGVECGPDCVVAVDALGHHGMLRPVENRFRKEQVRYVGYHAPWPSCDLAAVCHVNNETGEVADLVSVRRQVGSRGVLVVDGCQSAGRVRIPWGEARVDMLALSSRKVGGPGNGGALVIRKGIGIQPILFGGGQQHGLRPGTLDAMGAVMMADALEYAVQEHEDAWRKSDELRNILIEGLQALPIRGGKPIVLSSREHAVPHIVSFALPPYEGAVLKRSLAERFECIIGTGSACSAESGEPSHVLRAMGIELPIIRSALRVSFGAQNTRGDVEKLLGYLREVIRDY